MLTLAHLGFGLDVIDRFEGKFSFVVTNAETLGGIIELPVTIAIERQSSSSTTGIGR